MKKFDLKEMINGWFIGDFEPSVINTKEFEVAIKKYKKGDSEASHYHKKATEITVVTFGEIMMNNKRYSENDIILINRNESTSFKALTDCTTVVIKFPSVINDKYIVDE